MAPSETERRNVGRRTLPPRRIGSRGLGLAIPALLAAMPLRARLIADKGYDADSLRRRLAASGTQAVIPSTASRHIPYPLDRAAYRLRNVVERFFCRLKDFRRIATRYDKLARNFLAAVALVATVTWWAD